MFNRRRSVREPQYDISQYSTSANNTAIQKSSSTAMAAATAIGKSFGGSDTNASKSQKQKPPSRASSLSYHPQSPIAQQQSTFSNNAPTTAKKTTVKRTVRTQSLTNSPSTAEYFQSIQRKVSAQNLQPPNAGAGALRRHRSSVSSHDSNFSNFTNGSATNSPNAKPRQQLNNKSSRLSLPAQPVKHQMIKKWVPSAHGLVCIEIPSGAPSGASSSSRSNSNLSPITQRAISRASSMSSLSQKPRRSLNSSSANPHSTIRATSLIGTKPSINSSLSGKPSNGSLNGTTTTTTTTRVSIQKKKSIQSMHTQGNTSMTMEPTIKEDEEELTGDSTVDTKNILGGKEANGDDIEEELNNMKEQYMQEIENERLNEEKLRKERELNERLEESERLKEYTKLEQQESKEPVETSQPELIPETSTSTIATTESEPITDIHIGKISEDGKEVEYSQHEINEAERMLEMLVQIKEQELLEQIRLEKLKNEGQPVDSSLVSNVSSDEEEQEQDTTKEPLEKVISNPILEAEVPEPETPNKDINTSTTSTATDTSPVASGSAALINHLGLNIPEMKDSKLSVSSSRYSQHSETSHPSDIDQENDLLNHYVEDENTILETPSDTTTTTDPEQELQGQLQSQSKSMAQSLRPTLGVLPTSGSTGSNSTPTPTSSTATLGSPATATANTTESNSNTNSPAENLEIPQRSEKRGINSLNSPARRKSVLKNSNSNQKLNITANPNNPANNVYVSLATAENTRLNALSSQQSLPLPDQPQQQQHHQQNPSPVRRAQQQGHSAMQKTLRNSQQAQQRQITSHNQAQRPESSIYASAAAQQSHMKMNSSNHTSKSSSANGVASHPRPQSMQPAPAKPKQATTKSRPQSVAQFQARQSNSHAVLANQTNGHPLQSQSAKQKYTPSASTLSAKERVAELYKKANSGKGAKADGSFYNNPYPQHLAASSSQRRSSFERVSDSLNATQQGQPGASHSQQQAASSRPAVKMSLLSLRDQAPDYDESYNSQPRNNGNGGPTSYSGGLFKSKFANDSDEDLPMMNYKPSMSTLRSSSYNDVPQQQPQQTYISLNGNNMQGNSGAGPTMKINGSKRPAQISAPQPRFFSEQVYSGNASSAHAHANSNSTSKGTNIFGSPRKSKKDTSGDIHGGNGDDKKKGKIGNRLRKLFGRD